MRIFTAVRHSIDPEFYYGGLWSGNFYPALEHLGHEIVESEVDLLPASRFMHIAGDFTTQETEVRARITERIIEEVKRAHSERPIDIFLSYFYNAHFDRSGFDEIHRLGIPTVNFYCNSIYQFELVSAIAPRVTFAWHAEKHARDAYKSVGANPVWVQMGADPNVYHPVAQQARQSRACFIGQRYADRERLLAALIIGQVPVDVYGSGWNGHQTYADSKQRAAKAYLGREIVPMGSWKSYAQMARQNFRNEGMLAGMNRTAGQFVNRFRSGRTGAIIATATRGPADDISETLSQYEVVLNFSNVWADGRPGASLILHVRLRDFEAPMCRTCYLTGATDEIKEFYEIGEEIDTYADAEELVDKAKFYLTHPQKAEALREAGYRRALRDHTWERRFEELFRKIGLSQPPKLRAGAVVS